MTAMMAIVIALIPYSSATSKVDIVVYGSTPGGFSAAIAAAREGASVILLEPTNHVGGLSTGGLSHCDSNQMVRSTVMGIFDEWHMRIIKDYTDRGLEAPYDPGKKDTSRWTFEPHVAMRVTMSMLHEAGVRVQTGAYLKSITKHGSQIATIHTKRGDFAAQVYIDGTYEGDLMAAAGVDWTIGREGRKEYGESLAGRQYPKTKMPIHGLDEKGKLLPLITGNELGDESKGDSRVMTYSFRLCLTEDPENHVPIPEPDHYDPARFEIIRRHIKAGGSSYGFDLYPLPGNKFDGNNSIGRQFSIGLIGGGNTWHSSDEMGRRRIWEAHKQYTLEFYHFLTMDPSVPLSIRSRYARLGLCKDEFSSYNHFSPALYVRESRRMKGLHVLSQKDILEEPEKPDPIAISSFPIDSHDVQRLALKGGGVMNEGTIFPVRVKGKKVGYAYHVPYRSVLPKPEQCSNLLVPVALSCTHVGISSLRIEGAWMVIGQGAGVAAGLSVKEGVDVHKLPYKKLHARLLKQGQVLDLPDSAQELIDLPGVLDDSVAELKGPWKKSSLFSPHAGSGYIHDDKRGDGQSQAIFRFQAPQSGLYDLSMLYSPHDSRASNVPLHIACGAYQKRFIVDQTQAIPDTFLPIGKVSLEAGIVTQISINNSDTNGFVIIDAIRLVPSQF